MFVAHNIVSNEFNCHQVNTPSVESLISPKYTNAFRMLQHTIAISHSHICEPTTTKHTKHNAYPNPTILFDATYTNTMGTKHICIRPSHHFTQASAYTTKYTPHTPCSKIMDGQSWETCPIPALGAVWIIGGLWNAHCIFVGCA